jgi:hypothetical protein
MFLKKDNLWLGIVLGFIAPVAGMFVFYFVRFRAFSLKEFFQFMILWKTLLTSIISISLIANAVVFTVYINTRKDNTARGIFAATCVYAIAAILIKFVF